MKTIYKEICIVIGLNVTATLSKYTKHLIPIWFIGFAVDIEKLSVII